MKIIIANSNVGAIIEASKRVLERYSNDGLIPENVRGQTVLTVLKNISQRRDSFDICSIRELAKMNEVTISAEHYEFMSTLHCVKWEDMHQDTREYLMAILVDYFKSNIAMVHAYGERPETI
jgi:hypothetical protein